jgi:EAL domain-containing protein (putative c-di-GMP-specific phosphodiesterase class I)
MGGGEKLFLNVLATSLADPEWKRGAVATLLDSAARRPEDVVLEVSERSLGQQPQDFARACEDLRGLGFGLALDDVGTGYASLLALEALRPDYLKVDASLVRGIHEQLIKRELFTSIVQAAARIGAPVVAVGVEAEEEADALRESGASYGQGYLFALPGPAGRFAAGPAAGH